MQPNIQEPQQLISKVVRTTDFPSDGVQQFVLISWIKKHKVTFMVLSGCEVYLVNPLGSQSVKSSTQVPSALA